MCFMGGGSQRVQLPPAPTINPAPDPILVPQRNPNAGLSQYARLQVLDAKGATDALGNRGTTRQAVDVRKFMPGSPAEKAPRGGYTPTAADKAYKWTDPNWKAWYETKELGKRDGKAFTFKDIMSPADFNKVMSTQERGSRDWTPFIERFENAEQGVDIPAIPGHWTTETINAEVPVNAALGDPGYAKRVRGAILNKGVKAPRRKPSVSGAVLTAG